MPKLKTHTGAKKRFKLTKNGKVKRAHAFKVPYPQPRKTTKRKTPVCARAPMRTRPTWRRSNC